MREMIHIRRSAAVSAVLLAALFLLPLAVVTPFPTAAVHPRPEPTRTQTPTAETPLPKDEKTENPVLRVLRDGQVTELELNDYLTGVVRAEMPASFELEALKAQAVAARTYTLYQLRGGGRHAEADICTDSACCQAYLDEGTARKNWGEQAEEYAEKTARAVTETDGQTVLYEGEPILAAFHSSSAGLTRPAREVWSSDLPYLQAVESREAGEQVPNYYSRLDISAADFREKALAAFGGADLSGSPAGWLRDAVTDAAGNVKTLRLGGVTVRGSQLRSLLGLRSACFTWESDENGLTFFVTGYGHGVGLSQYGANRMAKEGADWQEILRHYYTGVDVGAYPFTNDLSA